MITIKKEITMADAIDSILCYYYAATPPEDRVKQILIRTRNCLDNDRAFEENLDDVVQSHFLEDPNFSDMFPSIADIKGMFEIQPKPLYELLCRAGLYPHTNAVYRMVCKKDGEEYFSFQYHGNRKDASRFCAGLVISELGDGDGENGGKGSLKNCIDEIAKAFEHGGNYCYADCEFVLAEVEEGK